MNAEKIKSELNNEFRLRGRIIFIAVFVIGIFVHGSRFFNEERFFDDLVMAGPGTTYTSGRWFLELLCKIKILIMGSHINTKGYEAIVVLLLLALMIWLMAYDLKIRTRLCLIMLSAVVVSWPYVISLFGYTYTAGFYNIGMIMALVSASLIFSAKGKNVLWKFPVSVLLLGLSMAVYQTTLCTFTAYLILLLVRKSMLCKNESLKHFILHCALCLTGCITGCLFYYLSNKLALQYKGLSMSSYQGLNNMGKFTPRQMLKRIYMAYREFFFPSTGNNYSLYYTSVIRWAYRLTLLMLFLFIFFFILRSFREKRAAQGFRLLLLSAIAPAAINSVFLTADADTTNIYSLMMFGEVMVFAAAIFSIDYMTQEYRLFNTGRQTLRKFICILTAVPVIFTAIYFSYTANVCYTKASFQYQQALGYFNRLIVRIQSAEGYKEGMQVAYFNERKKQEEALHMEVFDDLYRIRPYDNTSLLNDYSWDRFMERWCGFKIDSVDEETKKSLEKLPEVQSMPHYPDQGSVKVIDGVVVIRF